MKLKLVSCEVFIREACLAIAASPHAVYPEFTPIASHENADKLRSQIQGIVDTSEGRGYDAILLGFGLCGNATDKLQARTVPLVIPRAHDCCTIFCGSRAAFAEHFGNNLSAQWSCTGYLERCGDYLHGTPTGHMLGLDKEYQEMAAQYGEESARYLWETLHPKIDQKEAIYINVPQTENAGLMEDFARQSREQGKEVRVVPGDMRLITGLMSGAWDPAEYLVIPPGHAVHAVYDRDEIVTAVKQ